MSILAGQGAKVWVKQTKIFARIDEDWQYLAYSMNFTATKDVALILPLPIASSHEDSLKFLSLESYPEFFEDVADAWPRTMMLGHGLGDALLKADTVVPYETSFVPSRADFGRVNPQFQLPGSVWKTLSQYDDYGFAVFKLKPTGEARKCVLPVALRFWTRDPKQVHFPMMHVHHGTLEKEVDYDHFLYLQSANVNAAILQGSRFPAENSKIKFDHVENLIRPDQQIYKTHISGMRPNRDYQFEVS